MGRVLLCGSPVAPGPSTRLLPCCCEAADRDQTSPIRAQLLKIPLFNQPESHHALVLTSYWGVYKTPQGRDKSQVQEVTTKNKVLEWVAWGLATCLCPGCPASNPPSSSFSISETLREALNMETLVTQMVNLKESQRGKRWELTCLDKSCVTLSTNMDVRNPGNSRSAC